MPEALSIQIKSDGEELTRSVQVISIDTCYKANEIGYACLRITDGNAALETFEQSERAELAPGKSIEILAGEILGKEKLIFKGIVVGQQLGRDFKGEFYLQINLSSDTAKLQDFPVTQLFEQNTSDDALISRLLSDSGVNVGTVDSSSIQHLQFIQHNQSAWQCVMQRTLSNGFLLLTSPENTQVVDFASYTGATHSVGIANSNIHQFAIDLDVRAQAKSVATNSWSTRDQALNTQANGSPVNLKSFAGADEVLSRQDWQPEANAPLTVNEVTAWANAEQKYRQLDLFKGYISFEFTKENKLNTVKLGDKLELSGFGSQFNGEYFITGVQHDINSRRWLVKISVGLSWSLIKEQKAIAFKASDSVPYLNKGIVIGKVAAFEADPEQVHRIPVLIPGMSGQEKVWARLLSPFASNQEGLFVPPKENDEVAIAFWQDDVRHPVILGSVHNPVNPPPFEYDANNFVQGIFYRDSVLSVEFDQDQKIITTTTGPKYAMAMNEDDGMLFTCDGSSTVMDRDLTMNYENVNLDTTQGTIAITSSNKLTINTASGTEID